MTIIVTQELRVTLDSIRNSCDVSTQRMCPGVCGNECSLTRLGQPRRSHACGVYADTDNQQVRSCFGILPPSLGNEQKILMWPEVSMRLLQSHLPSKNRSVFEMISKKTCICVFYQSKYGFDRLDFQKHFGFSQTFRICGKMSDLWNISDVWKQFVFSETIWIFENNFS